MLLHGISKITGGIDSIVGAVQKAGLPAALGYLVYVGEVIAPLCMIAGVWTRLAALIVAINMVVAVALAHMNDIFVLSRSGGWALELQGFYLFTAVAILLLGAGRISVGGASGRWN
jgi:putative oxidoreductase